MNINSLLQRSVTILVFCWAVSFCWAQEQAILQVMRNQESAWNRGDLPGYMEGYWKNDSLQFIGSRGITYGWETTLHNYQKAYPSSEKMGQLSFTDIRMRPLSQKYAFVTGHWALMRKDDAPAGIFTLVFQKFKDGWKIISDHTQ